MTSKACRCGGIIRDKVCSRCGPQKPRQSRASELHNEWKWRKISERFREANPLCHDCEEMDIITPSKEVHHIQKVSERPDLKYVWSNLMALCRKCHAKRTAKGE